MNTNITKPIRHIVISVLVSAVMISGNVFANKSVINVQCPTIKPFNAIVLAIDSDAHKVVVLNEFGEYEKVDYTICQTNFTGVTMLEHN